MAFSRQQRSALFLSFFLSGAAALIYQVLWTRRLGLVFGVTVQAASTVLACFMAGLALGNIVGGRVADRSKNPLRAFAIVEALIGVAALITPWALDAVQWFYLWAFPSISNSPVVLAVARPVLASVVLIWPAALMGATFPLVVRGLTRGNHFGSTTSLLYGVNTAGAIAGTLTGGLWLVPNLGVSSSFKIAAGVNLLVAALSWLGSSKPPAEDSRSIAADEAPAEAPSAAVLRAAPAVLVAMAVSGFVSLALEVIWFRVLVFFMRPTTYAFAGMLAAVLAGITIGSLVVTRALKRDWNWVVIFGAMQVAVAIGGVLSFYVILQSYGLLAWKGWGANFPFPFDYLFAINSVALITILPVALLLGASFPIGLMLWTKADRQSGAGAGKRVGLVYAFNVGGGIAGSLVAGFVLVPRFGAQGSVIIVTAVALAAGLFVLVRHRSRAALAIGLAGLAVFGTLAWRLPDIFAGVIADRYPNREVLWHGEGAQATVSVTRYRNELTLLIDGAHHASDGPGQQRLHTAIGLLGVALHPDPQRVLVIGLGGGVTAGGASVLPTSNVDIVELAGPVLRAARFFVNANGGVLDRPNVHLRVDDGRNYLLTRPHAYDIITADLILPEFIGSANLYSADYFRLVARNLSDDGIVVQWVAADSEYQYKMMLRTFMSAFPNTTMWAGGQLLVGSKKPLSLSREAFEAKLRTPRAASALAAVGWGTFDGLLENYKAGPAELRAYVGDGPILTDDLPVIEYFLSLPRGGPVPDTDSIKGKVQDIIKK